MELIARGSDRTDLVYRVARPRSLKDRLILQAMEGQFRKTVVRDSATLIELAAADARERAAGRGEEPAVLAGTGRHLSEPLLRVGGPIAHPLDDAGAGQRAFAPSPTGPHLGLASTWSHLRGLEPAQHRVLRTPSTRLSMVPRVRA